MQLSTIQAMIDQHIIDTAAMKSPKVLSDITIKWASAHDWFVSASNGIVTVRDDTGTRTFNDFNKLYYWAKY